MIELREINKNFAEFKALNDINLMLPETGVIGLLGPNGADYFITFNCRYYLYSLQKEKSDLQLIMAKRINVFLAGLIGAAAGAVGGLLLAPKSGKETREQINKIAAELAMSVKTEVKESQTRLKDIYGNTTDEAQRKYDEVRNTVLGKVASLKTTGKAIDKDKYIKVVDEVVADFKTDLVSTKDGAEKLANYLKKDWEKVKKALA